MNNSGTPPPRPLQNPMSPNGPPLHIAVDDSFRSQRPSPTSPYSAPPSSSAKLPERTLNQITRASTTGSADQDPIVPTGSYGMPLVLSEDLNHGMPSPRPQPAYYSNSGSNSRSSTPAFNNSPNPSSESSKRRSTASLSSTSSSSSLSGKPPPTTASTSNSLVSASASCSSCGKAMQGPFVRALGTVFHLNCFKCLDCGDVVASKFFPIDGPDGKQQPLCERDYFKRLNLICAKCGMALRGSYITACNKKFHVEHFTCSLCPTLFGPQDSYYEHDGDVYCHFHYSSRFATKCAGCSTAILKQFVEINRNMRDECWHPECYMINKFWNVKVVSRRPMSIEGEPEEPEYVEEERRETPASLKDKQVRMEQQVYRIWTVLSAFEESSAACISDMLRQVSNGQYLDAIRMAEKFILHVEVLFASIDDLEFQFARLSMKGMSHVREARMLCRKTVELFTLLSHTQESGSRRMGMTQDLLALVTGLAHYLKILIRIALTGALKLEREAPGHAGNSSGLILRQGEAMAGFLDKLHLLAVQGGNPSARRIIKGHNGEVVSNGNGNIGTQGVTYGFRSLAPENAGESPFNSSAASGAEGSGQLSSSHPPSDLCVKCGNTVEEDCVRLGTYQRWHSKCVGCKVCGKVAEVPSPMVVKDQEREASADGNSSAQPPKLTTARRPPANVGLFVYEVDSLKETASFGSVPTVILCTDHAHSGCRGGFKAVQRLEQYAFLLNVALRRLYLLLRKQGVVPLSPAPTSSQDQSSETNPYRNSADITRMKQVHLDRKLSATARLPKWSTVVESPAGRSVRPSNVIQTQKSEEATQPNVPHHHHHPHHHHEAQVIPGQQNKSPSIPPPLTPGYVQQLQQQSARPKVHLDTHDDQSRLIRPAFARNNTEVKIIDESQPSSPAVGQEEDRHEMLNIPPTEDSITLADIGPLIEAAQAREQQRSLPRLNSIPYIAELSALELAIVKYSALLVLIRSPLKDQIDLEELLEMVEAKKPNWWKTFLGRGDKKNQKKKTGTFGVYLEMLVAQEGVDSLLGASRATLRVPSFIDDVISAMRQMDMSVEGIFRKNGNIRRLGQLTDAIDRDPLSVDLSQDNAVQLAALLKKFLRELPEPLMTFKLYKLWVAAQALKNDDEHKRLLHMISIIMPKAHRDTMEILFVFLKWVASFAHMDEVTGSKMDLGNLATVICPSILYPRHGTVRDESFKAIGVVTALLENQDEFFAVPEEFLPILHDQEYFVNSFELNGKDFMKKCDTYQKIKAVNGRLPTPGPYNGPNGSTPRIGPGPGAGLGTSPVVVPERPPPPPAAQRPYGVTQPIPSYPSSSSQHGHIGTMNTPRTPQPEEWSSPRPPINPNGPSTPSRPSSYVQPRASGEYLANVHPNNYIPTPNGYQPTRQRTG
ncbi:LIM domain-containing protein [Lentinula boryana]|uniref:LIM domain-containing protein n=1 Tax=Lentinula boryana TaxID=40481 RepID=A0ABQ8QQT6_9AGAR|nr:LIM domain-containing protein [Lentinula boryana]